MTYHGDFKLHQMPSTFDEAVAVYKDLPNKLGQNFENAIPQEIILFPLELIPEPKGKPLPAIQLAKQAIAMSMNHSHSMQMCKYKNVQVCNYTNVQV